MKSDGEILDSLRPIIWPDVARHRQAGRCVSPALAKRAQALMHTVQSWNPCRVRATTADTVRAGSRPTSMASRTALFLVRSPERNFRFDGRTFDVTPGLEILSGHLPTSRKMLGEYCPSEFNRRAADSPGRSLSSRCREFASPTQGRA